MPSTFNLAYSPNYKPTLALQRQWGFAVICNGESWPRIIPANILSVTSFYRLGLIPAFNLTAPSAAGGGSSEAGTYGICIVYRSSLFNDNLEGINIQSNRSNIVDVTLATNDQATLTKVVSTDTKVDNIDIYAAQKIGSVYGAFYRVVSGATNTAGTVIFSIVMANGTTTGAGVTGGTADASALVLATDNDFPQCQPILLEINGRLLMAGGITKRVTATFTNGSSTITTAETIYDGIEFWNFKRDSDTTGGINAQGTYLVRYASANSVNLVNADGTPATYSGTSGTETSVIWTEPNRKYSKPLNPHAFPSDNINNDYPSAILAAGKVPNTNRVLLMGKDWCVAEDYDRLPLTSGLNYISTEYGCASHFSIVAAHGRLYWLDFSHGKREIIVSDGSTVVPISTKKIKTILQNLTLDTNSDPFRIGFIHGAYYGKEDTIRWGLYLNNNTVPNYVLELDLNSGDTRVDAQFYAHRYLDVFTYGQIRGNVYIGQYGWTGGIANIGIDNIQNRYIDWVGSGDVSGDLDQSGQTTSIFTISAASFQTAGNGLQGIQVMIWQENTDGTDDTLIIDPTYYQCRISSNTGTTLTINYVEVCDAVGSVTGTDIALPEVPSGPGWKYAIGIIQGIAGPKWFTSSDAKSPVTFRELAMTHHGYFIDSSTKVKAHGHESFDPTPRDVQYMEFIQQGQQVADLTQTAHSRALIKTNPAIVLGFTLVDNNVNFNTTSIDIETLTLDFSDQSEQDDQMK